MTSIRQVSDRYPTGIRQVSDRYPTGTLIYMYLDRYPTGIRQVSDRYPTGIRQVSDRDHSRIPARPIRAFPDIRIRQSRQPITEQYNHATKLSNEGRV